MNHDSEQASPSLESPETNWPRESAARQGSRPAPRLEALPPEREQFVPNLLCTLLGKPQSHLGLRGGAGERSRRGHARLYLTLQTLARVILSPRSRDGGGAAELCLPKHNFT